MNLLKYLIISFAKTMLYSRSVLILSVFCAVSLFANISDVRAQSSVSDVPVDCKYTVASWSECDAATRRQSGRIELTVGDPAFCPVNKLLTRHCEPPDIVDLDLLPDTAVDASSTGREENYYYAEYDYNEGDGAAADYEAWYEDGDTYLGGEVSNPGGARILYEVTADYDEPTTTTAPPKTTREEADDGSRGEEEVEGEGALPEEDTQPAPDANEGPYSDMVGIYLEYDDIEDPDTTGDSETTPERNGADDDVHPTVDIDVNEVETPDDTETEEEDELSMTEDEGNRLPNSSQADKDNLKVETEESSDARQETAGPYYYYYHGEKDTTYENTKLEEESFSNDKKENERYPNVRVEDEMYQDTGLQQDARQDNNVLKVESNTGDSKDSKLKLLNLKFDDSNFKHEQSNVMIARDIRSEYSESEGEEMIGDGHRNVMHDDITGLTNDEAERHPEIDEYSMMASSDESVLAIDSNDNIPDFAGNEENTDELTVTYGKKYHSGSNNDDTQPMSSEVDSDGHEKLTPIYENVEELSHGWEPVDEYNYGITDDDVDDTDQSPLGDDCFYVFESRSSPDKSGTFTSPRYPAPYPADSQCFFELYAEPDEQIQISIEDLDIYRSKLGQDEPGCVASDRLVAKWPPEEYTSNVVEFGCGSPLQFLSSRTDKVTVVFSGNYGGQQYGNRGFKATYRFRKDYGVSQSGGTQPSTEKCHFQFVSPYKMQGSSSTEHFTTPNFPGFYPRSSRCRYTFVPRSANVELEITFPFFDIEGIPPSCGYDTQSDYVQILSESGEPQRFCGRHPLQEGLLYRGPQNVTVEFGSNSLFDGRGFNGTFRFRHVEAAAARSPVYTETVSAPTSRCVYRNSTWSKCDARTGQKKMAQVLMDGDGELCDIRRIVFRKCSKYNNQKSMKGIKLVLARQMRHFAMDVFQGATDQLGDRFRRNILLSPLSINTILNMVLLGARGNTKEQMKKVLGYANVTDHDVHGAYKKMWHRIRASARRSTNLTVLTANRLYGASDYETMVLPSYSERLKTLYNSEFKTANFDSEPELWKQNINRYVDDSTRGVIKNFLPPSFDLSRSKLVLINTIYFYGEWESKFDREDTHIADFHVSVEPGGSAVDELFGEHMSREPPQQVNMMVQEVNMKVVTLYRDEAPLMSVAELPYKGRYFSMLIFLPAPGLELHSVQRRVAAEPGFLEDVLLRLQRAEAAATRYTLFLPRFEVSSGYALDDTMRALGVTDVFTPERADLSGINGGHTLYVSTFAHSAVITVNEEGSEAAAATSVSMMLRNANTAPEFKVDRPFLFAILDNKQGTPLFLGRVYRL